MHRYEKAGQAPETAPLVSFWDSAPLFAVESISKTSPEILLWFIQNRHRILCPLARNIRWLAG